MSKFYIPTNGAHSWKSLLSNPETQWKKGYSAYELAHCWENAKNLPICVDRAFKRSPFTEFHNVEVLYAFPEYSVSLPGGGGSSQNDLYILGKANDELVPIMVEGKVSEPFGETVERWKGPNPSNGKRTRLNYLLELLNLDEESVLNIRYQFLHRAASAVIEAHKINSKKALMLVHSFSEIKKGYKDYVEFLQLFRLSPKNDEIVGPVQLNGISLYFCWVNGERVNPNEQNYIIQDTSETDSQKVELWSLKRLPFEPKGWLKAMRNELKESIKQLTPLKNSVLYCKFCTTESNFGFDVENVLLYNVGTGPFSRLSPQHLVIERSFEPLQLVGESPGMNNYHLYHYTKEGKFDSCWEKDVTVFKWEGLKLDALQEKPHEYWYRMKLLKMKNHFSNIGHDTSYGIHIHLGIPYGKKVNLTSICKPLLDAIISSFHCYLGDDLEEVSARIARLVGTENGQIMDLLLDNQSAVLGEREVVRRFQQGIQWNPADDFCSHIHISTNESTDPYWVIDGELFTIREK